MEISRKIYFVQFLIVILGLLIMTSLPGEDIPDIELFKFDKIIHLIAYFTLGTSFILFLIGYYNFSNNFKILLFTFAFGLIFGAIDELHQKLIPGRTASLYDWYANSIGIILSLIFIKSFKNIVIKYKKVNG
jgi:VanZ family protein